MNSGSITFPQHKGELRLGTVGLLDVTQGTLKVEISPLEETLGRSNPGNKLLWEVVDGKVTNYEGPVIISSGLD